MAGNRSRFSETLNDRQSCLFCRFHKSKNPANLNYHMSSKESQGILLSLANGVQLVITYLCVDKLSELQISLVGELSSAITLILMRRAGNSHSAETSKTDSGHGRVTG